jgi:hypothetical protein
MQQLAGNESVFPGVLCACAAKMSSFCFGKIASSGRQPTAIRSNGASLATAHYPPITKGITCPDARFMVKSQIRNCGARNQNEFTADP